MRFSHIEALVSRWLAPPHRWVAGFQGSEERSKAYEYAWHANKVMNEHEIENLSLELISRMSSGSCLQRAPVEDGLPPLGKIEIDLGLFLSRFWQQDAFWFMNSLASNGIIIEWNGLSIFQSCPSILSLRQSLCYRCVVITISMCKMLVSII